MAKKSGCAKFLVGLVLIIGIGLLFLESDKGKNKKIDASQLTPTITKLSSSDYIQLQKQKIVEGNVKFPLFSSTIEKYVDSYAITNFVVNFGIKNPSDKTIKGYVIVVAGSHSPRGSWMWPITISNSTHDHSFISVPSSVDPLYKQGFKIILQPYEKKLLSAWIIWPESVKTFDEIHIHLYDSNGKNLGKYSITNE